jgi:DNA-binding CsgD family transcriptional regulator
LRTPTTSLLAHVLLYGLAGGLLIALLRFLEYRWLLVQHSFEIYGGLIAAVFAGLGIWLGLKLTRPAAPVVIREVVEREVVVAAPPAFVRDDGQVETLGVTPRELEILERIAEGLSNQEIAARLFVSENTVKTHASRVFDKLGAKRRTQAVQRARDLRIIS